MGPRREPSLPPGERGCAPDLKSPQFAPKLATLSRNDALAVGAAKERGIEMELIISLIAGAVGGNVAGGVLKNQSLGALGNSIAGIVGGGVGGQILGMLTGGAVDGAGGMDIAGILEQVAGGGVGGGVALVVVGFIKNMMSK